MNTIHFPLRENPVTKIKMPVVDGLDSETAQAAQFVGAAIEEREHAHDASLHGDEKAMANYRENMRVRALKARVCAHQIDEHDRRLHA